MCIRVGVTVSMYHWKSVSLYSTWRGILQTDPHIPCLHLTICIYVSLEVCVIVQYLERDRTDSPSQTLSTCHYMYLCVMLRYLCITICIYVSLEICVIVQYLERDRTDSPSQTMSTSHYMYLCITICIYVLPLRYLCITISTYRFTVPGERSDG